MLPSRAAEGIRRAIPCRQANACVCFKIRQPRSFSTSSLRYPRLRLGARISSRTASTEFQQDPITGQNITESENGKENDPATEETASQSPKDTTVKKSKAILSDAHDIWRAQSIMCDIPSSSSPAANTVVDSSNPPPKAKHQRTPTRSLTPTSNPKQNHPPPQLSISFSPTKAYNAASKFFATHTPSFLYSSAHLRTTRANSALPEVAVIGASNCGKSSFVNALVHRRDLARTSARAGHTTTMNAYGVGPSCFKNPEAAARVKARLGRDEEMPRHSLVLVDTPGYGFRSQKEWGEGVMGYLGRRTMLRGVVCLLAVEKQGLTDRDRDVLRLVAGLGRDVLVVLTKADKLVGAFKNPRGSDKGKSDILLNEGADGLHKWSAERIGAIAGDVKRACRAKQGNIVPRVFLTAADMARGKGEGTWRLDPLGAHRGIAGARLAILQLAGLSEGVVEPKSKKQGLSLEDVPPESRSEKSSPTAWGGETISFEDLEKYGRSK